MALEVFRGTVCVTVTSQAPLWFRIRPQELGNKDHKLVIFPEYGLYVEN